MNRIIILFALALFFITARAQKAEKIYGNARQKKSIAYYKQQAIAWKNEIDKNPKDPNNWYNYYYVYRNLSFNDTTDTRSPDEKHAFIVKLVDEMGKHVPESYEYNLCKWMLGGMDMKLLPYLKKAVALGPERTEHLDYMINIGETERVIKDRDYYSIKKYEAGLFSTGIINYNYNVLAGLEKNAILLTEGDNDTYPVWYLQAIGIRKDVTLINLSLLGGLDEYRNNLLAELGVEKWVSAQEPDGIPTQADYERFQTNIVKHLAANKKKYPVYVALTAACNEKYLKTIMENLYLTGLSYLYSEKNVDNIALLKRNVEQEYALDYLDKSFYQDLSPDMVKII
ncbi:MAG: hypothetical protein IT236_03255, partial [Bacteroidia bacterium]|nr:hypothetical protein [Bacteroidia bacterium]